MIEAVLTTRSQLPLLCTASLCDEQRLAPLCARAQELDDVAVTARLQNGYLNKTTATCKDIPQVTAVKAVNHTPTRLDEAISTSLSKSARCLSVASKGMTWA